MAHVLHLVKDPADTAALEVIRAQAADPSTEVSIVLMHDAVRLAEPLPGRVYRLHDDHTGLPGTIGPAELLDLVFAADSVVTW